jgi:hypothetical protein
MTNVLATIDATATARAGLPERGVLVEQAFAAIEAATMVEDLTKVRDQWVSIAAYAAKTKDFEIKATLVEAEAV